MKIGKHYLTFLNQMVLLRNGLFHLYDHIAHGIHLTNGIQNSGPCLLVILVKKTTSFASTRLHIHGVVVLDQFKDPGRRHADPTLVVLDFFRYSNSHFVAFNG